MSTQRRSVDAPRALDPAAFCAEAVRRLAAGAHIALLSGLPGPTLALALARKGGAELFTTPWPDEGLPALSPEFPAAWPWEVAFREQYGREFRGGTPGCWRLPCGWPDTMPLEGCDLPLPPPLEPLAPQSAVEGPGVFRVPLGPVSSWVGESGFLLFEVTGEDIHHLWFQLNLKARGLEAQWAGVDPDTGAVLAELASGTSSVAHALAFSQAAEAAWGITPSTGALAARVVLLELERIANHLGDLARLHQATGLAVGEAGFRRLEEDSRRTAQALTAHRFLRGMIRPGGLSRPLPEEGRRVLTAFLDRVRREVPRLGHQSLATHSHRDRLEGTGRLTIESARALGARGPVARASGLDCDTRRDQPFALYAELGCPVVRQEQGDAQARFQVRLEEIPVAADLIIAALPRLKGPFRSGQPFTEPALSLALGLTEGSRGQVAYLLAPREDRVGTCRVGAASMPNALALPAAVPGNILTDFPVIAASFGLAYAGVSL
ncbi:MAG: hypothetical protein M0Z27_12315 [Thermaerobacter sp.]|nr:hypothetical protein [Thermaerobacter sp.]